jgi:hypothetical protein
MCIFKNNNNNRVGENIIQNLIPQNTHLTHICDKNNILSPLGV